MMKNILTGILFWGGIGAGLFLIRPKAALHRTAVAEIRGKHRIWIVLTVAVLICVMLFCSMLSPMWNGSMVDYMDEYERITESFLNHRLDFDMEPDPKLLAMENPYDTALRDREEVPYLLDHAYYQGRVYMYFGVVPVFLAFLPYRILTGQALPSVHASQLFAAVFMIGLAVYFLWLARKKFPQMTIGLLILLLILFSMLSTVYVTKFPTLYQTPIACGMMLEVWSLYFFSRAVWEKRTEQSTIRWAFWGSLCGALTFGCRPPLALANLVVLPMVIQYMKGKKLTLRRAGQLLWAASPYLVVAAGLMWYNYARFENPFEFGQRYQLTNDDQTSLGSIHGLNDLVRVLVVTWNTLFAVPRLETAFPFLPIGIGAVSCCPALFAAFYCLSPAGRRISREKDMGGFQTVLVAAVVIVVLFQAMWVPLIVERHKSDVLYLLSIGAFMGIGEWFSRQAKPAAASWKACLAACFCIALVVLLFLVPDDFSYTSYFQGTTDWIWSRITFNLNW